MKKTLSIVSALIVVSMLFSALGAVGANAAGKLYTIKDVNAYLFTYDNTTTVRCLFDPDLPDVPYITPTDYLNVIYADQFTGKRGADGLYTVTNAYGSVMVIDAAANTVHFDDYDAFMDCYTNEEGGSVELNYVRGKDAYYSVEPDQVTLDLGSYNIDIADSGGKVYIPLPVIAAMFSKTYNNAVYFEESICFVHTMDPESYYNEFDQSPLYESLTRTQEMADFNYNVLCVYMDNFFGKPSNTVLAEDLEEKGFDRALDEYDEYTQLAKQLLLSTDMIQYFDGLVILSQYCYDGGHTLLLYPPIIGANYYGETPLGKAWYDHFKDSENELSLITNYYYMLYAHSDETGLIMGARDEVYEQYEDEIVKEWEEDGAYLMIHGDMAVFVFDSFEEDTPYDFKEALDIAKESGVKNFLIDDSCNGGGYVVAYMYITAIITNAKYKTNEYKRANMNPFTGSIVEMVSEIDLNLDGVFDEVDRDVAYDFNFAILTSKASFSCGNELPTSARQLGIMIIGEPSGGGSCCVTERYLADGFFFPTSDIAKTVLPDGSDVDLGAPVDYLLTVYDEENDETDYSGLYDLDHISELMSGFYKTVTFKNDDGTVISEIKYRGGDAVIIPEAPVKEEDNTYVYSFIGWDKEVAVNCEGGAEYTAVYEAAKKAPEFMPGDINGDGSVDNKDVVTLFRFTSGIDVEHNEIALDVNGDGKVNNKDVVVLFRYVSGMDVKLSDKPYVPAADTQEENSAISVIIAPFINKFSLS